MSSILKALKKLEEEKALRRDEALDLPREILVSRRDKRSFVPFSWWLAIIVTMLLTIGLTTLVVSRRADHQADTSTARILKPTEPTVGSYARNEPQTGIVREETAGIKAASQRPPVVPAGRQQTLYPAERQPLPAPAAKGRTEDRPVTKALPSLPATAPLPPPAQLRKPAMPMISEPVEAAITVSGIAWNKDSLDRLAIINGQPTATGSSVNGFIVEEILPDRVRFSSAGKTIEILIGKSGKTN